MKCKVISLFPGELEVEVNKWLKSLDSIQITNVVQSLSSSSGHVTLTIFYLELKEVRKQKLDNINLNN